MPDPGPEGILTAVLEKARSVGLLGPGPVEAHVDHAGRFLRAASRPPELALDLGSGAGVPGLILALAWPSSQWVLLDAGERRAAFLRDAIADLDLGERVTVATGRAEDLGRRSDLRSQFELVTARGFGPPGVTAECGAPFLRLGGQLVVSEPPEPSDRWPAEALGQLGLERVETEEPYVAVLRKIMETDDRYPRRAGIPEKRPLF